MSPDLCDWLFYIIMLINLVHTCLLNKRFCTILLSENEQNAVTLLHSTQRKHAFLVKTKEKSKSQKQIPKKKFSLELLHQRLGHISTRSLLSGDTANVWQDNDLRVDPDPLCISCQISTINKISDQRHLWNPRHLSSGFSLTSYQPHLPKV